MNFIVKRVNIDDIHMFTLLRDLLLEQCSDLFQKWIFRFLYDIIAASTKFVAIIVSIWDDIRVCLIRYPLVSGLYRFATLVINICLKLNYFQVNSCLNDQYVYKCNRLIFYSV
jgi:hypothetical protein